MAERLTMQEIIDHCKETIQQIEYMYKTLYDDDSYEHIVSNCYWEHRQVAEWLKELQCYKYLEAQGRLIILPEDEGKVQAMNEKILELTDIAEAALKGAEHATR